MTEQEPQDLSKIEIDDDRQERPGFLSGSSNESLAQLLDEIASHPMEHPDVMPMGDKEAIFEAAKRLRNIDNK